MQQSVNLQSKVITCRAVLQLSKYLWSPNYSSVTKSIYGEFLSGNLNDFVDNIVSKHKKVCDTVEKDKTTITDVKCKFVNAVRRKMMGDLLYVKDGDQE